MQTLPKFIRTYQNAAVSIAILLFCTVSFAVALFPAIGKTQELLREFRVSSDTANQLKQKLDALEHLEEASLRQQLSAVLSAVPADRSFATLFDTVDGIAVRSGVTVTDLSIAGTATLATPSATKISASEKKLGTRTIPFSVTVSGTLPALTEFITSVPTVRRLLRIRVFSITFPKSARPLTVTIDMDAFYEPLPTSLGTSRSTLPSLSKADEAAIEQLQRMPQMSSGDVPLPPPFIGRVKDNPFAP